MAKHRPWSKGDIALLGTVSDVEAGRLLGRKPGTVSAKRRGLLIPALHEAKSNQRVWTDEENAMLGAYSDKEIAHKTGRSLTAVRAQRDRARIVAASNKHKPVALIPPWDECLNMNQDRFLGVIKSALSDYTGKNFTNIELAELTYYSRQHIDQLAGQMKKPMPLSTRRYFWLAAKTFRKSR